MPARSTQVGVVIVTHDRWQRLQRTLTQLHALPERPPVVVVDNGSPRGPPDELRLAGARLVRLADDVGAAARNVGSLLLDTPYVAFSDDDSWWAAGSLLRAADLFERHDRLGVIAARILVGAQRELDPTCRLMRDSPLRAADDPGRPVLGFLACGAIVRRAAFLDVGGFDPRYGFGGEEELLALDLASAGWQLRYVPQVVAHHLPSAEDPRPGRERRRLRNALWSSWRRRPLRRAAARSVRLLRGSGRDGLPALLSALAGTRWVLADRRVASSELEAQLRMLESN
ncbi:MAG TPA: glycosyltransferase [Solirubrobacteraceae bacterium]|jgi:GT2 family glycosyltransferase|nr:glycosyltransferase [Solirubrobacteraceae bacterium]